MIYTTAYDEIIDFIAMGTSPDKVIAFRPSEKMQAQVSTLLFKEKNSSLTDVGFSYKKRQSCEIFVELEFYDVSKGA